ncbi:MAG TPA: DnaD domain protein [Anaerolineales bacterium]|nr:DnaD domain protein [Anaerolineales bacterium]
MDNFKGFTDSETFTELPDSFFHHLLSEITDTDELKVTLYAIWRIEHMDGPFRSLCETDFEAKDLGLAPGEVASGLKKAVKRRSIIKSKHEADTFYFLNSPRGRAAADAFAQGNWRASAQIQSAPIERPNIFKLYEENIGPLTPLIADALKDAEAVYSTEWIADAVELAVKNNKRNWKYCEAILKRWKEEGRAEKQNRRDDQASRQRDVEGKIKKFVRG